MSDKAEQASKSSGCPICGKPAADRYQPFCSARCKQIDLHRWLGEVYTVPGDEPPANSDDPDDTSSADERDGPQTR